MQKNEELNQWFSTYGMITAERILGTFQISIPNTDLASAVKMPGSFYHQLLQVPLRNVLNGIVIQQAQDYHVYLQKLFIDYLLSGESSKGEEFQGAFTRESLEDERSKLVLLGEEFQKFQLSHDAFIASSQSQLIKLVKEWKETIESSLRFMNSLLIKKQIDIKKSDLRASLVHALIFANLFGQVKSDAIHSDTASLFLANMQKKMAISLPEELKQSYLPNLSKFLQSTLELHKIITGFFEQASTIHHQAIFYRRKFFETILRVNELISLLSDYKINPQQDAINREPLNFDKSIGEH